MWYVTVTLISFRNRSTQAYERQYSRSLEEKNADVDFDNTAEKVPEDLAGRVCYENEPLVLSWYWYDFGSHYSFLLHLKFNTIYDRKAAF